VRATYRAIGRSGWLQPVALLERPTPEAAAVPEGAPIPALDGTHLLHVEPGDLVRVAMGPVAPELLADAPRAGAPAASCPACGAPVVRRADDPFERCADDGCRGRVRARVAHVVGPRGLAITAAPARALEALLAAPQPLVELFELTEARIERAAPGLGAALLAERARWSRLALWRVIYLSHVHDVGERAARAAASAFEGAEQLLASPERVLEVSSLSTAEARAVITWARTEGRAIVARLVAAGVEIVGEPGAFAAPFAGKRVAFAGKLERAALDVVVDELERRGATIDARVSRLTDLVVAGRDGAAELAAAEAYDVLVVDEVALLGALRLSNT
jgi:DNA ligase (NAD+)